MSDTPTLQDTLDELPDKGGLMGAVVADLLKDAQPSTIQPGPSTGGTPSISLYRETVLYASHFVVAHPDLAGIATAKINAAIINVLGELEKVTR